MRKAHCRGGRHYQDCPCRGRLVCAKLTAGKTVGRTTERGLHQHCESRSNSICRLALTSSLCYTEQDSADSELLPGGDVGHAGHDGTESKDDGGQPVACSDLSEKNVGWHCRGAKQGI